MVHFATFPSFPLSYAPVPQRRETTQLNRHQLSTCRLVPLPLWAYPPLWCHSTCNACYLQPVTQSTTLPVTMRAATPALPSGEACTLHLMGQFLADPSARLHVRLNGRALGAFVCPEEELNGPDGADEDSDSNEKEAAAEEHWDKDDCLELVTEDKREDREGQATAPQGPSRASDGLAGRLSSLHLDNGGGSGSEGGSHVPDTPVLVFLDAAGEAGLAMLEWEAGGGSGLLGGWRPLVVAPDEGVAAELNALTQDQESAWWVGSWT